MLLNRLRENAPNPWEFLEDTAFWSEDDREGLLKQLVSIKGTLNSPKVSVRSMQNLHDKEVSTEIHPGTLALPLHSGLLFLCIQTTLSYLIPQMLIL